MLDSWLLSWPLLVLEFVFGPDTRNGERAWVGTDLSVSHASFPV